jgi:AAA domain
MRDADPVTNRASACQLVVFCGLPGVGKTAISRRVADQLGATFLRIDTIEAAIVSTLTPSTIRSAMSLPDGWPPTSFARTAGRRRTSEQRQGGPSGLDHGRPRRKRRETRLMNLRTRIGRTHHRLAPGLDGGHVHLEQGAVFS